LLQPNYTNKNKKNFWKRKIEKIKKKKKK